MARILMVSSEATPLAKTGGLADVVGSLPRVLHGYGHEAAVVLPRYGTIDLKAARRVWDRLPVWLGSTRYDTSIWLADQPTPFYLVDCPDLFDRDGLYGEAGEDYPDNHVRFAVFCKAALAVARYLFRPHILHGHDWQAGLIPVYLHDIYALDPTFMGMRTLFTVHNLGYQGLFPREVLPEVGVDDALFRPDAVEFFGKVSYLKGGIALSDALSTVSPTYAREIQTPVQGFGLDGVLRARANVLTGILNGIDNDEWNPATDPYIPGHFSSTDLSGKLVCKRELLREFGLPEEAMEHPLAGIVSRFASQKGFDLIEELGARLLDGGLNLVALGTGDPVYEVFFRRLAAEYPGRVAVRVGFDNGLAHRIEAGADLFLMPSHYEPCGLNQMYSLRYGTVPVVRATGGLDDTIEEATGFKFADYTGEALWTALQAAVNAYASREQWKIMMLRGMSRDFSWNASAGAYSALYDRLLER